MLKFYFHDGVRTAAAESLPYLLECAKIKGAQYLQDMWAFICPELLKAIETEPESEVRRRLKQQCVHILADFSRFFSSYLFTYLFTMVSAQHSGPQFSNKDIFSTINKICVIQKFI